MPLNFNFSMPNEYVFRQFDRSEHMHQKSNACKIIVTKGLRSKRRNSSHIFR
jgi:hypothetical protein